MAVLTYKERKVKDTLLDFQELVSRESTPFKDNSLAAKKKRYHKCKDSVEAWGREYCKHYFFAKSGAFHYDIDTLVHYDDKWIFPVHGPREHGKSVRARVGLMKRLLNHEVRYWVFASEHLELAWSHIEYIYSDLIVNAAILDDYDIVIVKKNEKSGKLRMRITIKATGQKREVMLQAVSWGTSGKGLLFFQHRPDGAFVDDFENTRSSKNKRISGEKLDWIIQELYPAVKNQIIWFGNTGKDTSALYLAMLKVYETQNKLKKFLKYGTQPGSFRKMIKEHGQITDENRQTKDDVNWYCISFRAQTLMPDGSLRLLWPEHHSEKSYRQKKATMGHLYEGEENGYPVKLGKIFKAEFSKTYKKLPELDYWFTWFDPAWGKSKHSCYKFWVILASNDGRNYYVVDAYCRQGKPIGEAIEAWYHGFEAYESNGLRFGKYEDNFGQDDRLEENLDDAEVIHGYRLNVYGDSNKGDKDMRIQSLENLWNLKCFHWPEVMNKDVATLYDQFLAYPDGEYVDGPDGFESCYRRLRKLCGQKGGAHHKSLGKRRYGFRRHSRK